jgi:hypothetical protein
VLFTSANFLALSTPLMAQTSSVNREHDEHNRGSRVSPAERIRRDDRKPRTRHDVDRPLDGFGNNLRDRDMNAADTPLRRLLANDYADQLSEISGQPRRTPREISNIVFHQAGGRKNTAGASDFVWQWGQFLDHDIDLTGGTDPNESFSSNRFMLTV